MIYVRQIFFTLSLILLSVVVFPQAFYIKQIQDSAKAGIFGQIAFMEEDSLNLYLVANTTYSPAGLCNAGNGLSFVFKINKANGTMLNSNFISGNPFVTKINCGFKLNNSLYLGGEMASSTNNYALVVRYDLISNQILWFKSLKGYFSPINKITSIKLNSDKKTITSKGVDIGYWAISPSSFVAFTDTIGSYWGSSDLGYMNYGSALLTNPDLSFSNADGKYYTIGNDFYSDTIYVGKTLNWSYVQAQYKKLGLKGDGSQFSYSFDKYILNIVNQTSGFTCFITDTLMNF